MRINTTPAAGALLLMLLIGGTDSRAQDPAATRKLSVEGVSLTLPPTWEWQAAAGSTIAIKLPVKLGERSDEVLAELFFSEKRFIGDRLQELQIESKANPADYKDFKIEDNQNFIGNPAASLVTYVKERGDAPPRLYLRRHFLFRKWGNLYEWREEIPKDAQSRASSPIESLRKALKISKPENMAVTDTDRDYVNQEARYKLPDDWNFQEGKPGPKIKIENTPGKTELLFSSFTDMIFKEGRGRLYVSLQVFKTPDTVKESFELNKKGILEKQHEMKDLVVEEKFPFRNEKGIRMSWTSKLEAKADSDRFQHRMVFFKNKGFVLIWQESCPIGRDDQAAKTFEVARKGLTTY